MKAALRFALATAVFACSLEAPATAQEANADGSSQVAGNAIGPPQLRDFSLDGTVTRQAEPQPERNDSAPPNSPGRSAATTQRPQSQQPASREGAPAGQPERQAPSANATPASANRTASLEAVPVRPQAAQAFTPAPVGPFAPPLPLEVEPTPFTQPLGDEPGGIPAVPWVLAILLFGGGAAFYLRRQRSRYALAGAPGLSELVEPEAEPRPLPSPPAPPPASTPAAPSGLVTTRLRPWLELEFRPERTVIDAGQAVVQFEIAVFNSGSVPARDVLIEAAMFNAGPQQDQAIGAFFARPMGQGEPVPVIPPLKRMAFRSAVRMPREQLQEFVLGGRKLFAPVIGVSANYRWSGGSAQTAASYLVGREGRGDKLAPLQAGSAPREIVGLAARELEQRVRR